MTTKFFTVTSIHRNDLADERGPSMDAPEAAAMTDAQMSRIAAKMEDRYVAYGGFWDDLSAATAKALADEPKEAR